MKITITLTDEDIRKYIAAQIKQGYGIDLDYTEIPISVKSTNNYRPQEWEKGELQIQVELNRTS